ncbi:MAG: prepilin peptidase [Candidatus Bipolaricaulia bacterium]
MTVVYAAALFILGLSIGSFLNVIIYRTPRGLSIVHPASHCPNCQTQLNFYDNIPLLSYTLLGGRCRYCDEPISWRYPIIEGLTGLLFLASYLVLDDWPHRIVALVLISALIVVTFIDLEFKRIPNWITFPGILLGLLSTLWLGDISIWTALASAVAGGGLLWALGVLYKGGMGGGDIKLAAMLGAFLGWQNLFITLLIASVVGSVIGGILIARGKAGRRATVPFGPFLSLGAIVTLLVPSIFNWVFRV